MPFDPGSLGTASRRKSATPQERVIAPEPDQQAEEPEQIGIAFEEIPIEPADLVVLAIGVIVSALAPAGFVSGQNHGYTM
jgi:hypothetical protein